MDAIELLTTRASQAKLHEPAPDEATLRLALQAAARAPDHKLLRTSHVFVIRGDARAALGELLVDAVLGENPQATAEELDKARRKPLRAPLILVVVARVQEHPKVPAVEQLLSAGAAAQSILLTLHARGFAAIWRTGAPAYHPAVKRAFGLSHGDSIVGFIYAGSAAAATPSIARATPEELASEWTGVSEQPGDDAG